MRDKAMLIWLLNCLHLQRLCQNQNILKERALRRRFIDSEAVVDGDSIKPRARGPGWAAIFVSSCHRQRQSFVQTLCRPHTRAWPIIRSYPTLTHGALFCHPLRGLNPEGRRFDTASSGGG